MLLHPCNKLPKWCINLHLRTNISNFILVKQPQLMRRKWVLNQSRTWVSNFRNSPFFCLFSCAPKQLWNKPLTDIRYDWLPTMGLIICYLHHAGSHSKQINILASKAKKKKKILPLMAVVSWSINITRKFKKKIQSKALHTLNSMEVLCNMVVVCGILSLLMWLQIHCTRNSIF